MQIVDHFRNGLSRTRDTENLGTGIDIIIILLSHTISEQGPKNELF